MYSVNFSDPDRTRTAKTSVSLYQEIATTLKIPNYSTTVPGPTDNSIPTDAGSTPSGSTNEPGSTTKKPGGGASTLDRNIYCLLISSIVIIKSVI